MSERALLACAAAVVAAAALAVAVPIPVVAFAVVLAAVVRRPVVIAVALALSASLLAARAEAGVGSVRTSERVNQGAQLVADPQPASFGWRGELRLEDGRRVWTNVGGDEGAVFGRLRMGERVEVAATLSPLDASPRWMRSRHLAGALTVNKLRVASSGSWWWRSVNAVADATADGVSGLDASQRALYLGVVLGDDRGQDPVQQYRFRAAGISHLLAVSGQNVALVLAVAAPLLGRLSRTPRVIVSAAILCWFGAATRLEPSVVRAVVMVTLTSLAWWHGRYASTQRVLWLAVIVLVLIDPLLVWSVGFALSISACIGLVAFCRPLADALPGPSWLRRPVAVALSAQALPGVMSALTFGPVGVVGVLVNLLAVPLGGALMVWGVVTGPVSGLLGRPTSSITVVPARVLLWALDGIARLGAAPWLPRIGVIGALGLAFAVATPWLSERRSLGAWRAHRRLVVAGACVVVVLDVIVGVVGADVGPTPTLIDAEAGVKRWRVESVDVWVLDVGASEQRALEVLSRMRRPNATVVIVIGGGMRSSAAVLALRQIVAPAVIFAVDPGDVRDASPFPVGPIAVGDAVFGVDAVGRPVAATTPVS